MAINLLRDRGTPLDRQHFTWKDLVPKPISKLDVDAFTRIRIILMNGIESETIRFSHACARMNKDLQATSPECDAKSSISKQSSTGCCRPINRRLRPRSAMSRSRSK